MRYILIIIIILIIRDARVLALQLMVVIDTEEGIARKVLRVVDHHLSSIRVEEVGRGLLVQIGGGGLMIQCQQLMSCRPQQ